MREFATAPIRQDRHVKADGWSLFSTLVNLWPYIWPSDRADLKARVLFATVLIFVAKLATIAVPFLSNGRPTRWRATAPRRSDPTTGSPGRWQRR